MTNYVLTYSGGTGMADTPEAQEAQEKTMAEWGAWFGASRTVHADGSATDSGDSALTGFSVVSAPDLAAAADLAKGCPILNAGGKVEVHEPIPM